MKHKLATGILFVVAAATPWCQATTINFDNVASPTALSNQYAAQGVVFNQIEATAQFATSVVPVSSPNYATPFYFGTGPRSLTFVDPSNPSNGAYADSVTITLNGYNNVRRRPSPPPTSRTGPIRPSASAARFRHYASQIFQAQAASEFSPSTT
jgi:hypothetical protein